MKKKIQIKGKYMRDVLTLIAIAILLIVIVQTQDTITGKAIETGVWIPIFDSHYADGKAMFSNTPDSTLSYKTTGPVTLITQHRHDFGMMAVYIDNQLIENMDLYAERTKYNVRRQYYVNSELKIKVTRQHNPQSSGNYIVVDKVITTTGETPEISGNSVNIGPPGRFTFVFANPCINSNCSPKEISFFEKLLNLFK